MNIYRKLSEFLGGCCMGIPSFALIPAAPQMGGGDNGDYMKTGQSIFNEGAGIAITGLYVVAILTYCGSLLWLLMQAKKHKEWGDFFKGAAVGLGVLVLILILLTQAKTALAG